ncbi:uncharacterized protein BDZ99DRAFT_127167 [Mytilinidion resinicola]|uniref:Uncharacterized protein n=1 Tax=Mytilinidion resinicola TaxID=574789 RepID=A0A6A6Z5B1_9PEZI|nr:uncharacterized protein BDZ99DRAFT_127167 [Mytilinidion resinicola]KAF2816018.1 hypothetical protein BDZ99DRAFT_127167 [Mytilinidion resinicola]
MFPTCTSYLPGTVCQRGLAAGAAFRHEMCDFQWACNFTSLIHFLVSTPKLHSNSFHRHWDMMGRLGSNDLSLLRTYRRQIARVLLILTLFHLLSSLHHHRSQDPAMERESTPFWATYRLRSPVECCYNTHFHQLFCKHIIATPTIEPCASNCLMPTLAPQPTPEPDKVTTNLVDEEFLCPKCVEEGGGSAHTYVLRNLNLRIQKLVMRHCYKYEEATILKFQESPTPDTQTTPLSGRILPCLHIQHGVPSPYHILECGHTVKVLPGDPAGCACNCAGPETECDGVFECAACLATGIPIDPVHGYRVPRN